MFQCTLLYIPHPFASFFMNCKSIVSFSKTRGKTLTLIFSTNKNKRLKKDTQKRKKCSYLVAFQSSLIKVSTAKKDDGKFFLQMIPHSETPYPPNLVFCWIFWYYFFIISL